MTDDELHHNSTFKVEYIEQARKLALLGAIDAEIIEFLGCGRRTFYDWRVRHPEFAEALKVGKEAPDERVKRSMYQNAIGYTVIEQQAVKIKLPGGGEDVKIVDVEKFIPPNATIQIYWSKNRMSDQFRDKVDVEGNVGVTVTINGADADL